MESAVASAKQNGEPAETNSYLVIFSDDGRIGASNQSYLGKVVAVVWVCVSVKGFGHGRGHLPRVLHFISQ